METNSAGHGDRERAVLHSHLASLQDGLDFINTLELERGALLDHLTSPRDALGWLWRHNLLHRDMLERELRHFRDAPADGERVMRKIRRVRAAMRELVDATVEGRAPALEQLEEVNRALRTHYVYELVPGKDGVHLGHRHVGDPVDGALARLAESIARELSQGEAERLRICENETCRWVFHDTSRTGRRKWCDMSTCGNRAKAARYRQRHKGGEDDVSGGSSGEVGAPH
jgi:predicted RNA-binding Zn ribbon-like protein